MDEILGQVLRNAVWERLDLLTDLAERADEQSVLSVARSELPRLTEAWRALLAQHEPDDRGMCPQCSRRFQPMRSPCSVWRAAYEHLVGGALAPPPSCRAEQSGAQRRGAEAPTVAGVAAPRIAPAV